ncbi:hypothetical protein [Candidatus Vidania fulgoroideorum]
MKFFLKKTKKNFYISFFFKKKNFILSTLNKCIRNKLFLKKKKTNSYFSANLLSKIFKRKYKDIKFNTKIKFHGKLKLIYNNII